MTNFIPHPNADGLVKLSGTIRGLKVTRDEASFVFIQSDQTKLGVVAIAAALAGQSGQAIATAANASSVEDLADYVEFELDGQPIKGWVWRNPFKEGDQVEVAAEQQGNHFEAFGITRPQDKTIALYPHCSRGRTTHVKNAVKWWLIGGGGVMAFICTPLLLYAGGVAQLLSLGTLITYLLMMAFFALVTYSMTRQWMPFVRLTEKVCRALEIPKPSNVDLVKSSKTQHTDKDAVELGVFYFRY